MSKPSPASSATSTIPQSDEFRIPRPVVMAGIELPELEMWRWWLRIKKFDMKTPLDRGLRGPSFGRPRHWQSKWFHEGYLGMPEEEIPFYPGPGKCEERAHVFLQKCKIRGAAELPYRTLLVGEDPSLY